MIRSSCAVFLLMCACSSSSSTSASTSGGTPTCPDVSGTWKVANHCDPSLVGQTFAVTESNCSLTFGAPFNGFTGSVTTDGKISVSGPQTCSGTASASAISMACTPGTCNVSLAR